MPPRKKVAAAEAPSVNTPKAKRARKEPQPEIAKTAVKAKAQSKQEKGAEPENVHLDESNKKKKTAKDALPVPTPEEMEKNKRFWTPFKSDASSGAAKATPSTNTAVVLPETKTENTDSDPEKRDMHKDDKATTVGDTVLGSDEEQGLMEELSRVLQLPSVAPTEDAIVAATLSTPVPEPSPDTVKPKEQPECDAGEAVASAGNVTLLRGAKVSLDNVVVVVSQTASSQAQLPHVIDTIMEKLDASESSVLLSQAKLHPRLVEFLKDMMGDDEFSPSDFASAGETEMDELVNLIQWLADRVVDDQPSEPQEPADASRAVPDVPSDSTSQPAAPASPREGEPWFFMRSFARAQLQRLRDVLGGDHMDVSVASLPRRISVMTACSGSGIFELATTAVKDELNCGLLDGDPPFKVETKYACEIIQNKQKFLREHIFPAVEEDPEAVCLFEDITKLDSDRERLCVTHKTSCALPSPVDINKKDCDGDSELSIYTAGFSCKSCSRANPDFSSLKTAISEGKDCSSTSTFRGVGVSLEKSKPHIVFLENVDTIETGATDESESYRSNLDAVLDQLRELGYEASATKLTSSHYGLPQRRCRYYIVAVRDVFSDRPSEIVRKIQETIPKMKVPVHPSPDVLLLPNDHPTVRAELERRAKAKAGAKGSEKASWKDQQHTSLAEQYGVKWPLDIPQELENSEWFGILPEREKEILCFVYLMNSRADSSGQIGFADISQSVTRIPTSTFASKVVPTILPSGKIWSIKHRRLLTGAEALAFQGLMLTDLPNAGEVTHTDSQLYDMAGNAFTMTCAMTTLLTTLAFCRVDTESEEEELDAISSAFQTWRKGIGQT